MLNLQTVKKISKIKDEPKWMLDFRIKGFNCFIKFSLPAWSNKIPALSDLDLDYIEYFKKVGEGVASDWNKVPTEIRQTFDKLGIPESERQFLAGQTSQLDSEAIYSHLKSKLEKIGVIFTDMDSALKIYPKLIQKYLGTVVNSDNNKFSALNCAAWSGGSFLYVPKGVIVPMPLQSYFRINTKQLGQFERTLIIADEGSEVSYIEGCTSPIYSSGSLHAGVVEVIAKKGAKIRYTTIQNWSRNIFNLVTKSAIAEESATIQWIDGNLGSRLTMKYPSIILKGDGSKAEIISFTLANAFQHQDTGAKLFHLAPNTTSKIISKSICKNGGKSVFRGSVKIGPRATNSRSFMRCDSLLLDSKSSSISTPIIDVMQHQSKVEHEATVSQIDDDQLFYLKSRGLNESQARSLLVNGFISQFTKELPLEFSSELNQIINLEMDVEKA